MRQSVGAVVLGTCARWRILSQGNLRSFLSEQVLPREYEQAAIHPVNRGVLQTWHLLSRTTSFMQAACVAFLFLLATLASIAGGQNLLESVLVSHVEEMVMAEVRAQRMIGGLDSAPELATMLRERDATASRRERVVAVQAADGSLLYGEPSLLSADMCADKHPACHGWMRAHMDLSDGQREWLGYGFALGDGGHYVVAYDVLPMLDRIYPVPLVLGVGVFLVLLLNLGAGLRFSLAGLRRVDQIRQAMARFVRGDMQARAPVGTLQDEFDRLGEDINRNLARIHRLMEEVRSATNHIAHELRTPLTRLQHRLSNIADLAVGQTDIHQEIDLAEEEARRIQQLFKAVMRISEIETGRCEHDPVRIDVPGMFDDLKAYYEDLAQERNVQLRIYVEPRCSLLGDRALLFQALVNLVDNAFKYAPASGAITLLARMSGNSIELGVADEGGGIAPDLRAAAVQRFRRLSRDRSIGGHGLGLALVQAVAELHGGELILEDNPFIVRQHPDADAVASDSISSFDRKPGLFAVLRFPVLQT